MTGDSNAVGLAAPDIAPYAVGNTGTPYVTTFDSRRPGPHVLVNALTHGNEICGAIALDRLFRDGVRPAAGKLTLSFANTAAYARFDPADPTASRFVDEDFNRLWDDATLAGPRQSTELARARVLRPLVASADLLLDIHSMQHASAPLASRIVATQVSSDSIGALSVFMTADTSAAGPRTWRTRSSSWISWVIAAPPPATVQRPHQSARWGFAVRPGFAAFTGLR